jgi:hypothetical protein
MIRLTVLNWERFNARSDVKSPSWFRLSHNIFEDHEFYDFTHVELVSWIYILCLASKTSSGNVLVNLQHLDRVGRIKEKDFRSAIEKLERNQCILVDGTRPVRARDASDTITASTLHNKTRQDITNTPPPAVFDFEAVYKKYPRKEGKAQGMKVCKAQIRSQDDYNLLSRAVERYAEHVSKNGTEAKFIKHFSTFMNSWRDWLDPDTGTVKTSAAPSASLDWDFIYGDKNGGAA